MAVIFVGMLKNFSDRICYLELFLALLGTEILSVSQTISFFLFSDTLSEIKMSFVLLNLILFTFPSHLDCYHLFWKEIFKQQTPTKESKRNAVQFLISLSHLIFYSFGMTAENSPFDIFHDTFLCLEKKLTFYWVYLIIKSFSLESSNARWRSKSKNKHTTQLNIYSTQTSS